MREIVMNLIKSMNNIGAWKCK